MRSLSTFPIRSIVLDVYLHKLLASERLPAISSHLFGPDITPQADRWATGVPSRPPLRGLPHCIEDSRKLRYSRHREFARATIDATGHDRNRYVGFRCEVEHPIWRVPCLISFEFRVES